MWSLISSGWLKYAFQDAFHSTVPHFLSAEPDRRSSCQQMWDRAQVVLPGPGRGRRGFLVPADTQGAAAVPHPGTLVVGTPGECKESSGVTSTGGLTDRHRECGHS